MYVHSVKLINFKSIGDYPEAEIVLEPKVTAIIGKNESGKSNVLKGLSYINLAIRNNNAFNTTLVNRNGSGKKEVSYIVTLKASKEDGALRSLNDTTIAVKKDSCIATGGIVAHVQQELQPDINSLFEILESKSKNPFQLRNQEWQNYQTYYDELNTKDKVNIFRRTGALNFIQQNAHRIAQEKQERLENIIERCREKWLKVVEALPVFYYRNVDKQLRAQYNFDDVQKELNNPQSSPNSLLSDFVKLIEVPKEDFIIAARSGSDARQMTIRKRINNLINEKINVPFREFYQTESLTLELDFNAGVVSFAAQSENGEAFMLSERSNGLKWYLNTFIDARANNIPQKNVVYLFDEPGTSLHVNAQRELIKLFHNLSEQGNQVVYATHSPYMLNTENDGIHRIRAVTKDKEGYTYIYKTAYDSRIASEAQQDTLAPIINAIGMNLNDTFGPAANKINIVTEGISDYIYLYTMARLLDIDMNEYAIIPAAGASNCVNICSILHGWGCKYIALFDYDTAGVKTGGEYLRKKMMFEFEKQYCYIIDISQCEVDEKTYQTSPCVIEDLITKKEIDSFCDKNNISSETGKSLMAKIICNAVESGEYQLGEECKDNFQKLFNRIFSYFEK